MLSKNQKAIVLLATNLLLAGCATALPNIKVSGLYSPTTGCDIETGGKTVHGEGKTHAFYKNAEEINHLGYRTLSTSPSSEDDVHILCSIPPKDPTLHNDELVKEPEFSIFLYNLPTDTIISKTTRITSFIYNSFGKGFKELKGPGVSILVQGGEYSNRWNAYEASKGWIEVIQEKGAIISLRFKVLLRSTSRGF